MRHLLIGISSIFLLCLFIGHSTARDGDLTTAFYSHLAPKSKVDLHQDPNSPVLGEMEAAARSKQGGREPDGEGADGGISNLQWSFMGHMEDTKEKIERLLDEHDRKPPKRLSLERRQRTAKLIKYHLMAENVPAVTRLVGNNLDHIDMKLVPEIGGAYLGLRYERWGRIFREIWIRPNRLDGILYAQQKILLDKENLAWDQVERLGDLIQVEYFLHEMIAIELAEKGFEDDVIEGELFELIIQSLIIRNLNENDFNLLLQMHAYVDEFLTKQPYKIKTGIGIEYLKLWRGLDKGMYKEVIKQTEKGLEWFEKNILPTAGNELYHDKRRIEDVIKERRAKEESRRQSRQGKIWKWRERFGLVHVPETDWDPILDRNVLNDMNAKLGFEKMMFDILEAQNVEHRKAVSMQALRATKHFVGRAEGHMRDILVLDPFLRALRLAATGNDLETAVWAAEMKRSVEMVVDIQALIKVQKLPDGSWQLTPNRARAVDLLEARSTIYDLVGRERDPKSMNDALHQVRINIFAGDVPIDAVRKTLNDMGLKEDRVAVIAGNPADFMEGIRKFRKENRGYEDKFVVDQEIKDDIYFLLTPDNATAWTSQIHEKFGQKAVVVVDDGTSIGEAVGMGFLVDRAHVGNKFQGEQAAAAVNRWLALTLPAEIAKLVQVTWDPLKGVFNLHGNAARYTSVEALNINHVVAINHTVAVSL